MIIAVLHSIYEIVVHKAVHDNIAKLGVSAEDLQRTFDIAEGAIESGLAAVYATRDEVNRAIRLQIKNMP
jgi:hypothetical protein